MKSHLKVLIAATLLVVFGLGGAAGYFGERYVVHHRHAGPQAPQHPRQPADWMARTLGLDAAQRERVSEIFKRHEADINQVYADSRARMQKIRGQLKTEIDSVLTPEQIAKMDKIIQERRQRQETDRRREHAPAPQPGAPDQGERR